MKNTSMFLTCAIAAFIPWGSLLHPFGLEVQVWGLLIQVVGMLVLFFGRKHIF